MWHDGSLRTSRTLMEAQRWMTSLYLFVWSATIGFHEASFFVHQPFRQLITTTSSAWSLRSAEGTFSGTCVCPMYVANANGLGESQPSTSCIILHFSSFFKNVLSFIRSNVCYTATLNATWKMLWYLCATEVQDPEPWQTPRELRKVCVLIFLRIPTTRKNWFRSVLYSGEMDAPWKTWYCDTEPFMLNV